MSGGEAWQQGTLVKGSGWRQIYTPTRGSMCSRSSTRSPRTWRSIGSCWSLRTTQTYLGRIPHPLRQWTSCCRIERYRRRREWSMTNVESMQERPSTTTRRRSSRSTPRSPGGSSGQSWGIQEFRCCWPRRISQEHSGCCGWPRRMSSSLQETSHGGRRRSRMRSILRRRFAGWPSSTWCRASVSLAPQESGECGAGLQKSTTGRIVVRSRGEIFELVSTPRCW